MYRSNFEKFLMKKIFWKVSLAMSSDHFCRNLVLISDSSHRLIICSLFSLSSSFSFQTNLFSFFSKAPHPFTFFFFFSNSNSSSNIPLPAQTQAHDSGHETHNVTLFVNTYTRKTANIKPTLAINGIMVTRWLPSQRKWSTNKMKKLGEEVEKIWRRGFPEDMLHNRRRFARNHEVKIEKVSYFPLEPKYEKGQLFSKGKKFPTVGEPSGRWRRLLSHVRVHMARIVGGLVRYRWRLSTLFTWPKLQMERFFLELPKLCKWEDGGEKLL